MTATSPSATADDLEARSREVLASMIAASPALQEAAGGLDEALATLERIDSAWLDHGGIPVHLGIRTAVGAPRGTIVFQPGSGSHGLVYSVMAELFARSGYHVVLIDRPGHGLSGGERGHCTIDDGIAVGDLALDFARSTFGLPVVLLGTSMGGLLAIFGLLAGSRPDVAVAHNFVYPGKLASMRLRAWWTERRGRPVPLVKLVHGFEELSRDPGVAAYMHERNDPAAAFELSAESVASLFRFKVRGGRSDVPTMVLTGTRDKAIPALATRFFAWLSGLEDYELVRIPQAGHLLFHDHVAQTVPLVVGWLNARV